MPPPKLTVSQWADEYRVISQANAEPGRWRTARVPYQREPMDLVSDPDVQRITLMWGAQTGKALPLDTEIPTPLGWTNIESISIGDDLYDENGKVCKVLTKSKIFHGNDCYKITFDDHSDIVCDADHLWTVNKYKSGKFVKKKTLKTEEIAKSYINNRHFRYSVDVQRPIYCETKKLPISPYLMGVWLGDGSSYHGQIYLHKNDVEIADYIRQDGHYVNVRQVDRRNETTLNLQVDTPDNSEISFTKKLRELNLLKSSTKKDCTAKKVIPEVYLRSSIDQRFDLLKGLMDTDGTIDKRGRCEFYTAEKGLCDDVYELICSLGFKVTCKFKETFYVYKGEKRQGKGVYTLSFFAYDNKPVFKLKRKLERQKSIENVKHQVVVRRIVDVAKVKSVNTQCIGVSSPSNLFLAGRQMVPTHNTDGLINNTIGYYIHQNPKSIMVMHPTQTDLNTWIEAKLTPLINETPALTERVAKPRSRDGVNNKTMKGYPGGYLMFSWSGSPNTQRGRSAPIILCDEIDGYEFNAEGDPVQLLWQRSATFGDARKLIETSTPTIKGISRIEKSFDASDQRRFYIPCPSCDTMQILKWGNVKWDKDELGEHDPTTAYYQCGGCEHHITDTDKIVALKKGEWRADKPFKGHAGFHLNELYSPFRKWRDIVQSFLDKKRGGDLQSFVNVSLAETWEEVGESANDHELFARREKYEHQVPDNFWVLTAGVDVQDDRLEIEVVAWDDEERSANIDYRVIYGDPSDKPTEGIWKELDAFLNGCYSGKYGIYQIASACVDSGGHHTSRVYDYCKTRRKNRIFAIKGRGGEGLPIVSNPYKRTSGREKRKVELYIVGVDGVKVTIMRRLQLSDPKAPGYCLFPEERDADYFKQLTAEKLVTRYKQGQAVRSWSKAPSARNEALDCRVYAFAALKILNPVWAALMTEKTHTEEPEPEESVEEAKATSNLKPNPKPKAKVKRNRRRRGFASGW